MTLAGTLSKVKRRLLGKSGPPTAFALKLRIERYVGEPLEIHETFSDRMEREYFIRAQVKAHRPFKKFSALRRDIHGEENAPAPHET